jgi:SRSO17 transposase
MGWDDAPVRVRLRAVCQAAIPDHLAYVIDDTGIEKKGVKSPGVHRQYTGTAGKVTNCQIVVSTHLASHGASAPLEMDLYMPEVWCSDAERRLEAGVPEEVAFHTKPELALAQLDRILEDGGEKLIVLADAGYGDNAAFRDALTSRGLPYAVGVSGTTKVWRPNEGPDPPKAWSGRGRPPTRQFPGRHSAVEVREYARELPDTAWQSVDLRPGETNPRTSRFAAQRVRSAHRATQGKPPGEKQCLLIEWPEDTDAPTHYFLLTLPPDATVDELARTAKLRWRVERDYQDMKQEVGFAHYEGRRWVGFNHHLTICMAAITYMIASRALFPPEDTALTRRGGPPPPAPHHLGARPMSVL